LQESIISVNGKGLRIYNTHLSYLSGRQRQIQATEIMRIVADAPLQGGPISGQGVPASEYEQDWIAVGPGELADMPQPALLMGDFNMRPNCREYDILVGEVDPTYGRLPEMRKFSDVLTLVGMAEKDGVTHPEGDAAGYFRIDHIFVSGDLVPTVRRAWIDDEADGSDHQPVFAEIDLGELPTG
jgi:endonuclease/exonuclease/phosphatase family metal-dependent hydrolase